MANKKIYQFRDITSQRLTEESDILMWVVGDSSGVLYKPTITQLLQLIAGGGIAIGFEDTLKTDNQFSSANAILLNGNTFNIQSGSTDLLPEDLILQVNPTGIAIGRSDNLAFKIYPDATTRIYNGLRDSLDSVGTDTQLLTSTGTGLKWVDASSVISGPSNLSWKLTGNTTTNPATDFIGTIDAKDLYFRANNVPALRIEGQGKLDILNNEILRNGSRFIYTDDNKLNAGIWSIGFGTNVSAGTNLVAVGFGALEGATTLGFSVAVGTNALKIQQTGSLNVAVGWGTMSASTAGSANVAVGTSALNTNAGSFNTAIGNNALKVHTTGDQNVAIGASVLAADTTGTRNTGIGSIALNANTTGSSNTAVGKDALAKNTTGNENTAIGYHSLSNIVAGNNNIAIGANVAQNLSSGNNNIAIGNFPLELASNTGSNQINIGGKIYSDGTNIGLLTSTQTNKVDINGDLRVRTIAAGVSGTDSVLVTDTNGVIKKIPANYYGTGGSYILPTASSTVLGGIKVGSGLSIDGSGVLSGASTYVLPTASDTILGGIKVGANLSIDGSGTLSALSSYVLPIASPTVLGGIKTGTGLSIDGAGVLSTTPNVTSIGVTLDGGGSMLTTGQKGYVRIPYNGTITGWSIISKETGSATFDVWKRAGIKPTVAQSITAAAKPTLTSSDLNVSTNLTGWNTAVSAGDIVGWNLDSVATSTWAILQLTIVKS